MKKKLQSRLVRSVLPSLVVLATVTGVVMGQSSSDVIKLHGRDDGLCLLVGCGDEKSVALAAELAATGDFVVHGIALDDTALRRARGSIRANNVAGLAAAEKLPLHPLPYRDNLANLMVVADLGAAKAAGFSTQEAMRVIAPGGKLCVFADGKWETSTKPWPKEMDEWTHEAHGPDGNCVSQDRIVKFPVGYRWHAGLPMNLQRPKRSANTWSSTRGMALAGGRCFTLSDSVLDNLGPTFHSEHGLDQYVTARDAFNGLLLWRRNVGATYYGGLFYPNRAPFAAVGDRVYVATGDGKLLALDAATGDVARTFQTTHEPGVLLIDDGVVVVATWKDGARVGGLTGIDRRRMTFALAEGTVEAFDAATGGKLWSVEKLATSLRSAEGVVYLLERLGPDKREELSNKRRGKDAAVPPRPEQAVVAVGLRSGKALWTVRSDVLGTEDPLRLDAAGLGVVTVSHDNGKKTSALSAKDGKLLFQAAANSYTAFHDGAVCLGRFRYDPQTGKQIGPSKFSLSKTICTPRYFVNDIVVANRGSGFLVDGKPAAYRGARGGCLFASIPAFGAFFTPQNWCRCAPSQIQGLIAFGPIKGEPTAEQMEKAPALEKGPAYTSIVNRQSSIVSQTDWPMYRHDAGRSNRSSSAAPRRLDVLWQTVVCNPAPQDRAGVNWRERLTDPLTAPTVAEGVLLTAATDRHQVIALDAGSGSELWRRTVGGRIDTPPTIHDGACLFGSHDGWIYALSCRDGRPAWQMRAAPTEERMVSYGQVESPWPVIGTVLVSNGVAYASAGRSQGSDGGVVVRAFKPATGEVLWSKAIGEIKDSRSMRLNDLLLVTGDCVQSMITRMDPKTGELQPNPTAEFLRLRPDKREGKTLDEIAPTIGLEGFIRGNWTRLGNRKSVSMGLGNVQGDLAAWNGEVICTCSAGRIVQAVRRDAVKPAGQRFDPKDRLWSQALPAGYQATAIVVCPKAVVIGGGVFSKDEKANGFVQALSIDKGEKQAEQTFSDPLTYNSIAVAGGLVYCTLTDGSAVCLGGK